jgi:hypothetical protein
MLRHKFSGDEKNKIIVFVLLRLFTLPFLALKARLTIRTSQTFQIGQVHALRNTSLVRRVELAQAFRAGTGRRVADGVTHGVGAALGEVEAGVRAGAVDAGRVLCAIVVEVATVLALPILAHLSEWTVRIPPASGKTDSVTSTFLRLLTEFAGQAVCVIEAYLDASPVDATLTK